MPLMIGSEIDGALTMNLEAVIAMCRHRAYLHLDGMYLLARLQLEIDRLREMNGIEGDIDGTKGGMTAFGMKCRATRK